MQIQGLGELAQGHGDPSDYEWRGKLQTADGPLYLWIANGEQPDLPPQPHQVALAQSAVQQWEQLKERAVSYVRDRVRAEPDEYGLEEGEPTDPGVPDWLSADLTAYLQDFQLRQVGIPVQEPGEDIIYLGFETQLDWEHGCVVEMVKGEPVREAMTAAFEKMLIL